MPLPLSQYKQSLIPNNFNIRNRTIFIKKEYPFIFQVINTQIISGKFSTIADKEISIDWGDGSARSTYSGTNQAWSKNYGSAEDRTVRIFGAATLTMFKMDAVGANISFDIANLPSRLTYLIVSGNNTVFGNIANAPLGITYIAIYGNNTLFGDIANAPSRITTLAVTGNNTLSGDIASAPSGITYIAMYGNNTLFGNIANAPSGITYLYISGNNIIADYSGKTWITKPTTFCIIPVGAGGLSEAEIDQLFIDFDDDFVWTTGNVITLTGVNAAPSAASAAARTNIANEGCTITTN